jgi:hypothetical protein
MIIAEILTRACAMKEERMKLPQTGGCQCGAIRYEITEAPQLVYVPLHRLPAFDEQRLLPGDRRRGERLSSQRDGAATTPAHG